MLQPHEIYILTLGEAILPTELPEWGREGRKAFPFSHLSFPYSRSPHYVGDCNPLRRIPNISGMGGSSILDFSSVEGALYKSEGMAIIPVFTPHHCIVEMDAYAFQLPDPVSARKLGLTKKFSVTTVPSWFVIGASEVSLKPFIPEPQWEKLKAWVNKATFYRSAITAWAGHKVAEGWVKGHPKGVMPQSKLAMDYYLR